METSKFIAAMGSLAQNSRFAVFRALVCAPPTGMAAGKISEITGIPPSSLTFHLKELTHAEMISVRHEGRFAIYSANTSTMTSLIQFLNKNCCSSTKR